MYGQKEKKRAFLAVLTAPTTLEITVGDSEEIWEWHVGAGLYIIDESISQDFETASDVVLPFFICASYVKMGGIFIKEECGSSHRRRKS